MNATKQQRHDIFLAAQRLLASGGPEALRVRTIADAAGCSTMAVYSRFGGKNGIVDAIYIDGFTRLNQALRDEKRAMTEFRMQGRGLAYRLWALANPGAYQIMFSQAVPGFAPSAAAAQVAAESFQVLVVTVRDQQREGLIRAGDAGEIAWAVWGVTHGLVMLELANMSAPMSSADFESVYVSAMDAIVKGYAP